MCGESERLRLPSGQLDRPNANLPAQLPTLPIQSQEHFFVRKIVDAAAGRLRGTAHNEARVHHRDRQRPRTAPLFRNSLPPCHGQGIGLPSGNRGRTFSAQHSVGCHHKLIARHCDKRCVAPCLSGHVGHSAHPRWIECRQPRRQHKALLGCPARTVQTQANKIGTLCNRLVDAAAGTSHRIACEWACEHHLHRFPAALQRWIGTQALLVNAQASRQFGWRSGHGSHNAQLASQATAQCQRHGPEWLHGQDRHGTPQRVQIFGFDTLLSVVG